MDFCPSKVFVGGLSQNVDKAALKRHFETFGEVRDAVVMMDRTTSRSRGFGFVRFAAPDAVEAVLRTPHLLDGQWIDVKRAQPAEQLPPPKYPRAREEGKKKRGAKAAVPEPAVGLDASIAASAASWAMWNMMMGGGQAANPFFPQFPVAPTPSPVDISSLLSSMNLGTECEDTENIPKPMNSPLGDLSNMIEVTSPAKSPSKSPDKSMFPHPSPIGRKASPLLDITAQLQAAAAENATIR